MALGEAQEENMVLVAVVDLCVFNQKNNLDKTKGPPQLYNVVAGTSLLIREFTLYLLFSIRMKGDSYD